MKSCLEMYFAVIKKRSRVRLLWTQWKGNIIKGEVVILRCEMLLVMAIDIIQDNDKTQNNIVMVGIVKQILITMKKT